MLNGFRIPALITRRTETEVELHDGQTFAIAGLMNNTLNSTMQKIPGIGDIPILGQLFRSKAAQKNQTELVVMITPEILPRELDRRDDGAAAHAGAVPAAAAGEEVVRAAAAGVHAGQGRPRRRSRRDGISHSRNVFGAGRRRPAKAAAAVSALDPLTSRDPRGRRTAELAVRRLHWSAVRNNAERGAAASDATAGRAAERSATERRRCAA